VINGLEGLEWGALVSALGLGLRHGFDWDHIAAITDLNSTQARDRGGIALATLYILGHALVVTALGMAAIMAGATIPAWMDAAMGRMVGVTLVALGLYLLVSLLRHRRDLRLASRWMLALAGMRRVARWVKRSSPDTTDTVEFDHEHEHGVAERHATGADSPGAGPVAVRTRTHRHRHTHRAPLPPDPFAAPGRGAAFAVGLLHGVGAETPTQVLIFATAAGAASAWAGAALLGAFVVGLIAANTAIAVLSHFGALSLSRNFAVFAVISVVVAALSLYLGLVLALGLGEGLPAVFG
jgi:hypothetical protein